jgi:hypothetical protein
MLRFHSLFIDGSVRLSNHSRKEWAQESARIGSQCSRRPGLGGCVELLRVALTGASRTPLRYW